MRSCQSRLLVPFHIKTKASRRGQSKISGRLAKVDLRDVLHALCCTDNRKGWRKFPSEIQKIFRVPSQGIRKTKKFCAENRNQKEEKGEDQLRNKLKPSFLGLRNFPKLIRLPRNGGFDLVGVELNPGPTKGKKKKVVSKAAKKPKIVQRKPKLQSVTNKNVNGYTPESAAYLRSVLAPCSGNARIPDFNTTPTVLCTLTQEITVGTSAGGVGGVIFDVSTTPSFITENVATTVDSAITYNGSTALTGQATLLAQFAEVRVVSACLDTFFMGSTNNDQGLAVGWQYSVFAGALEGGTPTTLTAIQSSRSNQTIAARKGISVFHRTTDFGNLNFQPTATTVSFSRLGVHFTGVAANQSFYCKFTVNFECIPKIDTFALGSTVSGGPQPSPVDLIGFTKATNIAVRTPPYLDSAHTQSLTSRMAGAANNIASVWATAREIFGFAQQAGKLLV